MLRVASLLTALATVAVVVAGCQKIVTEKSDILTEPATVADLVYMPSRHGSASGPTIGMTGGELSVGVAVTSVSIPEQYAVVFQCQHGKFVIQSKKAKDLWNRLTVGQKVTVSYREIYKAVYEDKKLISRSLEKYDFLDAR